MDLGFPEPAVALLAAAAVAFGLAATARYGTALNPLTVHCAVGVGLFTLVSALTALTEFHGRPPDCEFRAAATITAWTALAHLFGVAWPYLYHGRGPSWLFGQAVSALSLDRVPRALPFRWSRLLLFLAVSGAAYVALAVAGGGGSLWLTSPRRAYILHRAGAGPFYMLCQWSLMFGFVYALWYRRPRGTATLCYLAAFAGLAYFTGSKNNVLSLCAVAICYHHFRVRRLPFAAYAVLGPLILGGTYVLLVVQGSYADFRGAAAYFSDYFGTTTWFLERFDEFGFRWGRGWLSSFWFFVPRGLFPGKPFEYGETLIHQVLFPGDAAAGNTPGLLPWSLAYLDFGLIGVFATGWLQGVWQRATYEYYIDHRENVFAFLLMVQFGIWAVFTLAPAVLLLGWLVVVGIVLRVRASRRLERRPEPAAAVATAGRGTQ